MRVVVVENSLPTQQMLRLRLSKEANANVVAVATKEDEAVETVLSHKPDLVTLDLGLDQGTGVGVLRRLQAAQFAGTIFVFSSEDACTYATRCVELGASRYFRKLQDDQALFTAATALAGTVQSDGIG